LLSSTNSAWNAAFRSMNDMAEFGAWRAKRIWTYEITTRFRVLAGFVGSEREPSAPKMSRKTVAAPLYTAREFLNLTTAGGTLVGTLSGCPTSVRKSAGLGNFLEIAPGEASLTSVAHIF
jgi:hypothetical protein